MYTEVICRYIARDGHGKIIGELGGFQRIQSKIEATTSKPGLSDIEIYQQLGINATLGG